MIGCEVVVPRTGWEREKGTAEFHFISFFVHFIHSFVPRRPRRLCAAIHPSVAGSLLLFLTRSTAPSTLKQHLGAR